MQFDGVKALTFDCYGTLIDWERGIIEAFQPWLRQANVAISDEELLEQFARIEAEEEGPPWKSYRQVLIATARRLAVLYGMEVTRVENAFVGSFGEWPPFPDTVEALRRLKKRFQLVITSNVDRDLFARTNRLLEVEFDRIITAEDVGSYKPEPAHFERAIHDLELTLDEVVHVAQSLYHDHVPAKRLGLRTVWINRRAGRQGGGATLPAEATPDLEFSTLGAFADYLEQER